MSRRAVYWVIGGALVCVFVLWLTRNFAIVHEEVWTGPQGEAAANPFLAARMLLARMGSKVVQSQDLERLAQFAPSGTLFLADRTDVTPPLVQELLAWVRRGGHLIVAAEYSLARDPLLHELSVSVRMRRKDFAPPRAVEIELPDGSRLQAALPRSPVLLVDRERAHWWYEDDGGMLMVELIEGRGRVTILSGFAPFHNRAIGQHQHAELMWRLASPGGAAAAVWLVRRLQTQSLPGWLAEHALPVLVVLGLLLILALWRVMPRFGPLVAQSAPDRRSLTEHLTAMGRFYSGQGQLAALIKTVRQDALDALGARMPETRGEDGAARLKAAARVSGMSPRDLRYAFTSPATTARDFAAAIRLLREFRAQLAQGRSGDDRHSNRPGKRGKSGRVGSSMRTGLQRTPGTRVRPSPEEHA
jgi:hypothetical protein